MTGEGYEELLGRQLFEQGRFADAEAAFRLALARHPSSARIYLALAQCLDVSERADEALTVFRRAVELDPSLADAHNGVGICESDLGRAEAAFRQAILLEPGSAEFHANLAYCLLRQGRAADAEPCLRQAVRIDPDNLAVVCDWGDVLVDLHRLRDAETLLEKAISRLVDRRALLDSAAWRHYQARRYEEAEERFRRLREPGAIREEPWIYCTLGRTLRAQQKLEEAMAAVKIAIALKPRVSDFHDDLARLCEESRLPDLSGAAYHRARELPRS